jgi:hypothetical protein
MTIGDALLWIASAYISWKFIKGTCNIVSTMAEVGLEKLRRL